MLTVPVKDGDGISDADAKCAFATVLKWIGEDPLRAIPFYSHCEHHLAPIVGRAWVSYVPNRRVVGISKLARVVEAFARRLQIQERMTAQIANVILEVLEPQGVAVLIKAQHHCISGRGVNKEGIDLVTSKMLGCFRDDARCRAEFLATVSAGDHV